MQKLLENGSAYYCFCNDRRLSLLRKDAIRRREVPKYDNRCRFLTKEETEEKLNSSDSYCIRFKVIIIILMNSRFSFIASLQISYEVIYS